jgi:hypothetical protein
VAAANASTSDNMRSDVLYVYLRIGGPHQCPILIKSSEHKLSLNGMTVRGSPSQSATDALNKLNAELVDLERRAQLLRDGI